jgi:hypothetical protein
LAVLSSSTKDYLQSIICIAKDGGLSPVCFLKNRNAQIDQPVVEWRSGGADHGDHPLRRGTSFRRHRLRFPRPGIDDSLPASSGVSAARPPRIHRRFARTGGIPANKGRTEFDPQLGLGKPRSSDTQRGRTSRAIAATGGLPTRWHFAMLVTDAAPPARLSRPPKRRPATLPAPPRPPAA